MIGTGLLSVAPTAGPSWVNAALIVAGWPVTALLGFWAGSRQKMHDRRADFYRGTVVTPSVEEINRFFADYRQKLGDFIKNPPAVGGKAVPRGVSKLHLEFSEDLRRLSNAIAERVHAFDSDAVRRLTRTVDGLDDNITAWLFSTKPRDEEVLFQLLVEAKRNLIRDIYKAKLDLLR